MSGGELLRADILELVRSRWDTLAQRIPGAWQTLDTVCASPLAHHIVASATSGLWRFTVQNRSELLSFIVKRIAPTSGASAHWQSTLQQSDPAELTDFSDRIEVANCESPEFSITARTIRTEFLIAQKIHAALTQDEPDYEYGYAPSGGAVLFARRNRYRG